MVWWDSDKVVTLQITSWMGTSAYGIHYYGKLLSGKEKAYVMKTLTLKEAREINRLDRYMTYKAGYPTDRMKSPNEVRRHAKKQWKNFFPKAILLLEGNFGCVDPQLVLDGPRKAKQRLNEMYHDSVRVGDWMFDESGLMKSIRSEWDKEMQKLLGGVGNGRKRTNKNIRNWSYKKCGRR